MNDATRLPALSVILACTVCATVSADDRPQDRQGQPATAAPAPKQPAPLFHRHHRGTYKDSQGLEMVDATPQSPPLETDDPGVPDNGEWEINLTTLSDRSKGAHRVDLLLVDTNYGVLPKIAGHELPTQLKFEFPVSAASANAEPFTFGVGDATAGLKFNFYNNEHTGMAISVYPQVEFALPGSSPVEQGLAEPGQTLMLPLLVAKEFRYFTFVANGGVEKPVHNPDGELRGTYGVAFGRALTRKIAAMLEVRGEAAFAAGGDHPMFLNVGVLRGAGDFVTYANWGHSLTSGDDSHGSFGAGAKLLIRPRQHR